MTRSKESWNLHTEFPLLALGIGLCQEHGETDGGGVEWSCNHYRENFVFLI
jgi:hypothetical protein